MAGRVLPNLEVAYVETLPAPASLYVGQHRRTSSGLYYSTGAAWVRLDTAEPPLLDSGVYLPIVTEQLNIASSSVTPAQFMQVGDVVNVSGFVTIVPTAAADAVTELRLTVPVAASFIDASDAAGTAIPSHAAQRHARVAAVPGTNQVFIRFTSATTGSSVFNYIYTYSHVSTAPTAPPVNIEAPAVTPAVFVGDSAGATPGVWQGQPSSFDYQWQTNPGTGWEDITGATSNSFGPINDPGDYRVRVVATNLIGASAPAFSAPFTVSEAPAGFTWGYANAVGEIVGGVTARRQAAASGYANFRSAEPLPTGKFYVEGRLQYTTTEAAFGLIGDGALPSLTNGSYVTKWESPNASVYLADIWSLNFLAAYGHPEQVNGYFTLDGSPTPLVHVVQMAIDNTDPSEVLVWVRIDGGAWYGSGDPVAGTGATITLPDTVSLYLGAVSQDVADTSTILTPAEHEGTPPSGFTPV